MSEAKTTIELAISEDTKRLVHVLERIVEELRIVQSEIKRFAVPVIGMARDLEYSIAYLIDAVKYIRRGDQSAADKKLLASTEHLRRHLDARLENENKLDQLISEAEKIGEDIKALRRN
jgi:hypothetical protein